MCRKYSRNRSDVPDVRWSAGKLRWSECAKWSAREASSIRVSYLPMGFKTYMKLLKFINTNIILLPITLYLTAHGWHSLLIGSQCSLYAVDWLLFDDCWLLRLSSGVSKYWMNSRNVTSWPRANDSVAAFGRNDRIICFPILDWKYLALGRSPSSLLRYAESRRSNGWRTTTNRT